MAARSVGMAALTTALAAALALAPIRAGAKNEGGAVALNGAEAADVSRRLAAEPRLLRVFATCPADTFERERPFWRRLAAPHEPSQRSCARHPAECYDLCVGWSNASACLALALAYEGHRDELAAVLDKERLFALACAEGSSSGCTNRAAALRNRAYPGDPFRDAPLAAKQACEARSFRIDCERGGTWGCAMLGQAYRNGEGVAPQPEAARTALEGACANGPQSSACRFAKALLREMNAPGSSAAGEAKPQE